MSTSLLPEWNALRHPVIGMLHAPPLPGSPHYADNWSAVRQHVLSDAEALSAGGVNGLMLENFGDVPFFPDRVPAVTVSALTALAVEVRQRFELPLGMNVLRNDGRAALAIAAAVGAQFIRVNVLTSARVTDQGIVQGIAHDLLRERAALKVHQIRILADVDVKHSAPMASRPMAEETRELIERGGADAVIVSGTATGAEVDRDQLQQVRTAAGNTPVFIGSGATPEGVSNQFPLCDGFIVGTAFKPNGNAASPIDVRRVAEFMAAVRSAG